MLHGPFWLYLILYGMIYIKHISGVAGQCENGWLSVRNTKLCVKYYKTPMSWFNARSACREQYSFLPSLYYQAFVSNIDWPVSKLWTSMKVMEGQLYWHNEANIPVQRPSSDNLWQWRVGHPVNSSGNCGLLSITKKNVAPFANGGRILQVQQKTLSTVCTVSLEDCSYQYPFLCIRDTLFKLPPNMGPVKITVHPENMTGVLQYVEGQSSGLLHCEADNYLPNSIASWIKDGYLVHMAPFKGKVTLDIQTLKLPFYQVYSDDTFLRQGFYYCQVWGAYPFQKITSYPALMKFTNVLTYQGRLHIPNQSQDGDITLARLYNDYTEVIAKHDLQGIINHLTFLTKLELSAIIHIHNIRKGPVKGIKVDFTLYYPSYTYEMLLYELNGGATFRDNHDPILSWIRANATRRLSETSSYWYSQVKHLGLTPNSIIINSTTACQDKTIEGLNGEELLLVGTAIGSVGKTHPDNICMSDGAPLATALCLGNFSTGAYWGPVRHHQSCSAPTQSPSTAGLHMLAKSDVNESNAVVIASDVAKLTNDAESLQAVDMMYTSRVLRNLATVSVVTEQVGEHMLKAADNILKIKPNYIRLGQQRDSASTRVLHALDAMTERLEIDNTKQVNRLSGDKIALEVWEVSDSQKVPMGFGSRTTGSNVLANTSLVNYQTRDELEFGDVDTAILLPSEVLLNKGRTRISYLIFQSGALFMSPTQLEDRVNVKIANSQVIAAKILKNEIRNLNNPILLTFKPVRNDSDNTCVFWDHDVNGGRGNWSRQGCVYNGSIEGRVICLCDHLTNFAILTDIEQTPLSRGHILALSVITILGLVLSILGLSMVILTAIMFRKFRKTRTQKVLVNLAASLLLADIIFLAGINQTENEAACMMVAALLSYFLLAAFFWMLVEGVLQYLKFVKVFDTYVERFMWKAAIPAWGIPGVIVCLLVIIDYNLLRGPPNFCWLSKDAFYYAFMLPVSIIIIVNTAIFTRVIKAITCDRNTSIQSNQSERDLILLQVRSAITCFVVLGVTWVFGFLALSDAKLVFQYLFCIFNSIQGFLIFVFHNIREKVVRDMWRSLLCGKHAVWGRWRTLCCSKIYKDTQEDTITSYSTSVVTYSTNFAEKTVVFTTKSYVT